MFHGRHTLLKFVLILIVLGGLAFLGMSYYFEKTLPDVEALKTVQMQVPLRIYSADGKLIAEFGEKRRTPVPLSAVPKLLTEALIATEDQRFYEHHGVDIWGLFRASLELITTGKKSQGGSTLTMQVARNFFLTRKKTFARKIHEILLALKISHELNKDTVLELYLNEVYFGSRAYGVAAAAQIYYGKSLNQLTLGEMAMIAGLPQAPSAVNPIVNPAAAKDRRQHVLQRMLEQGYITQKQYDEANNEPIATKYHQLDIGVYAPYVAEAVRNEMVTQYGEDAYTLGLKVYTTIDSHMQLAANRAVSEAVTQYDHRHGYRGATANWGNYSSHDSADWQQRLAAISTINNLQAAAITHVSEQQATALLANGKQITLPWSGLRWAARRNQNATDFIKVGDLVRVDNMDGNWRLDQIPAVEAALVALNPQNGATLALVGGYNFTKSNFNRVYQAQRQPGSSIKPFIYAAALEKGLTFATIMNDGPFVGAGSSEYNDWRPDNDDHRFMGMISLRVGLILSRNLVSIRVLQAIGIDYAINYLKNFGFDPNALPHNLTLALGTPSVTPMQMAVAYSVFANGGYKINDYLIDKVVDEQGKVLYQAQPVQACESCITAPAGSPIPASITNPAPRVISPQIAYLVTSALQEVITSGTGRAALVLNRSDLAGKTGTTNDFANAWFDGFNSDVVAITWMGFDQNQSLKEYGAQSALPMWIDFMRGALAGKPLHTMPRPPGLVTVKINPENGLLATNNDPDAIFETFRADNVPKSEATATAETNSSTSVYGGLY